MAGLGPAGMQGVLDRKPKGPCPNCGLKVRSTADVCPHCAYQLTDADRESLRVHLDAQHDKGVLLGLVIFPSFIALVLLIYYLK